MVVVTWLDFHFEMPLIVGWRTEWEGEGGLQGFQKTSEQVIVVESTQDNVWLGWPRTAHKASACTWSHHVLSTLIIISSSYIVRWQKAWFYRASWIDMLVIQQFILENKRMIYGKLMTIYKDLIFIFFSLKICMDLKKNA